MQPQLSFTGRIASFSFRHKWYVLGAWLVLLVTAAVTIASGVLLGIWPARRVSTPALDQTLRQGARGSP